MASKINNDIQISSVNRFLRCRKTQRYFTGDGWSDDPTQAKPFTDPIDAVRACVHKALINVELVLRAPGTAHDLFTTPLR